MKHIALLLISAGGCLGLAAQDGAKKWSLEDCINYAVEHNITTRQLALQKESAAIDLHTARTSMLPNLNASMGQSWNFGRNQTLSGLYENRQTASSSLYLSSSMPLFTGMNITNQIRRGKLLLQAATEELESAREDVALHITALFLQVLYNKEMLRTSEEQVRLSQRQVAQTKVLVEVGKAPKAQLYDVEAQVARDEVVLVESKNSLQLALLELAQSLELERTEAFDIAAPEGLDSPMQNALLMLPDAVYDHAVALKPAIRQQEYLLESAKKSLAIARSAYYPQLSLGLSYSNNYFYNYNEAAYNAATGQGNIPLGEQWRNNGGESISLSLNIPLFNRFQTRNQVRAARLGIRSRQLALNSVRKELYKQIQTAYANATAARERYVAAERAAAASRESFKYAEERYAVGNMSVFELNDAKTKLLQSESAQIQAKYEYILRSKILDFYKYEV
jgi:outer membrane protein